MNKSIVERLRAVRGYRVCECAIDRPINPDGPEAAAYIEMLEEALKSIRDYAPSEASDTSPYIQIACHARTVARQALSTQRAE